MTWRQMLGFLAEDTKARHRARVERIDDTSAGYGGGKGATRLKRDLLEEET